MQGKESPRRGAPRRHDPSPGFTLIDLVVALAVIAILLAMLVPSLGEARRMAEQTVCCSNLRQMGLALTACQSKYRYFPEAADGARHEWQNHVPATWIDSLIQLGFLGTSKAAYCPADARPDRLNAAHSEYWDFRYPGKPAIYGIDYSYGISFPLAQGAWRALGQPDYPRISLELGSASRLLAADAFWCRINNLSADALARGDGDPSTPSRADNTVGYRHPHAGANVLFVDTHVETVCFDLGHPSVGVDTSRVYVNFAGESVNQTPPSWSPPEDYPYAISPRYISDYGLHGGWTNPEVFAHKGWSCQP